MSKTYIPEKVSVIIPTYNRFQSLMVAIRSVQNQTYKNIEIIVIDDCSTQKEYTEYDFTKEDKVIYKRLEINNRIKHNSKYAQGLTRNEGILIATGEYIAFLDDDDYYYPNKIEIQLLLMKKWNYQICSSNMFIGNGTYRKDIDKHRYFKDSNFGKKLDDLCYELDMKCLSSGNYVNNSSVILHRSILDKVGIFKDIQYEDYDLWKRIVQYYNILYISECLVYYDMGHAGGIHYG